MLGIKLKHMMMAHPEANAVTERINTSIKCMLKSLMAEGYTCKNS